MRTEMSDHTNVCFRVCACFGVCLSLAAVMWAQDPANRPDLILRHGHIFTGAPEKPWVEAVAISGDHIVATGTDAVIVASADRNTQIIDLQGAMAMPGINDSHDHVGGAPYGVEARTRRPAMADPAIIEIADAVRAAAAEAKPGEWITAQVGPAAIRHARETRKAMDEAGGGHPVMLEAWWGHGIMLNAAGLAKLGIDDSVKELPGGRFDRDPEGHLTGLLEENTGNAIRRRLSSQIAWRRRLGHFEGMRSIGWNRA